MQDTIRLGEEGWQRRYYREKFCRKPGDRLDGAFFQSLCTRYVEGLRWVLLYYYKGCPSWDWFFPYHFAPLAATLAQFSYEPTPFKLGKPFRPLDQLMANQPPGCAYLLPKPLQELMTSPTSPIRDFYPKRVGLARADEWQIEYDTDGLPFRWLWTALISFIDKDRLLAAIDSVFEQLSPEDLHRNHVGVDLLCVLFS